MSLAVTIGGKTVQLVTVDQLRNTENWIAEVESRTLNNEEQIRLGYKDIESIKAILNTPVPPVPREGIEVGPDDNLQEAIQDANGKQIWLKDGIYEPVKVVSNTKLKAINPGNAIIQGTIPWSDGWQKSGNAYYKELKYTFYQHPAHRVHGGNNPSARGLLHRKAQQPHMLVFEGKPLKPVYNKEDLGPGMFWLEGSSDKPIRLWLRLPDDLSPSGRDLQLAISEYLVEGMTGDVDGVALEGLKLQYCANTGVHGAIQMEAAANNWILRDLDVLYTMSEGIRMRGEGHLAERCKFNYHAHLGMGLMGLRNSKIIDCETSYNAWMPGLDVLWHSGGIKGQYGVNDCQIIRHKAHWNEGPGIWLDIDNLRTDIIDPDVDSNTAFGLHIELRSRDGSVTGGTIKNTFPFDTGQWIVQSDLRVQAAVTGYTFKDLDVGMIYYKKKEGRGYSGDNTFENINYSSFRLEGDKAVNPDKYINFNKS